MQARKRERETSVLFLKAGLKNYLKSERETEKEALPKVWLKNI